MKKKDFIYPAIFLVIALWLLVIPVGAFLTSEVVGFSIARSIGGWIYYFLKDHGSLIAGTLAVLTAFFTIKFEKHQFKKDALESDRRESLESLFKVQENSLLLARCLEFGRDKGSSSIGKITKEEIEEMAPLSRDILRRTIIINSYLEDSDRKADMCLVDLIIKQTIFFEDYLNYMSASSGGPLNSTQSFCLNLKMAEIIEAQNSSEAGENLYQNKIEFDEVKLHGHYQTNLSIAWGQVSKHVAGKLITSLLKK